jgi:hypothetical protein
VPLEADPVFRATPFLSAAKTELQEPAGPAKLLECLAVLPMVERPDQVDKRLGVPIVERSRCGRLNPRSHLAFLFRVPLVAYRVVRGVRLVRPARAGRAMVADRTLHAQLNSRPEASPPRYRRKSGCVQLPPPPSLVTRHFSDRTFEDTLHPQTDIAFAHIDCDWYDPVRLCLERIVPRLSAGAYVVLDDYNDYGGCRRAVDEFLEAGPDVDIVAREPNFVFRRRGGSS